MTRVHPRRRARRWLLALGVVAVTVPSLASADPRSGGHAEKRDGSTYEVKNGDTLGAIAKRFGVGVRALIEANRLSQPDLLRPGQRLVIPGRAVSRGPAPPASFVLTAPQFDGQVPAFRWPVEGPISSPFGRRTSGWHTGIDIKAEMATPVLAAAAGTVLFSGWEPRYGRVVKIEHENGFLTVYAHNLRNFVEAGDEVRAGQVIGTVGRTGRASAYHLHFEIRNNGKVFNPLFLLPSRELEFVPEGESQADESQEAHD